MTADNLDPRERGTEPARESRETPAPRLSDQEVPIGKHRTPQSVQAWLDGELPEAAARRGNAARDVDFWRDINAETETRRKMRTPIHVQERIMAALPQTTPRVITPWWRRQFVVTPAMALAVGTALLALGVALAAAILRAR
jgi:hypothetical protein